MRKPEKRTRIVTQTHEYWFCGQSAAGHYHATEESALACIKHRAEVADQKASNRKNRLSYALACRRDGMTFKAIGAELNISGSRAAMLVREAEREEQHTAHYKAEIDRLKGASIAEVPVSVLRLSVRSSNAIKNAGLQDKTIGDLLKAMPGFKRLPNMGAKSVAEIMAEIEMVKSHIAQTQQRIAGK